MSSRSSNQRAKGIPRARMVSLSVAQAMVTHSAFESAAAIAFWFFLSLVPLLVLVGFLLGLVARAKGVDELVAPLLDVVPGEAQQLVVTEVERLAKSAPSLAPLSVAGYLWTASSGLHNLMDVLETVAQSARRTWWKQRAIALGWVVLGLLTAFGLAWLLVEIDSVLRDHTQQAAVRLGAALKRRPPRALVAPHEPFIAAILLLGAGMTLLAGFYRTAVEQPSSRGRPSVWPGTIGAVVSWLVVSWAFGAYAASIANYALYYGGLAAVAVLLVWLYLTSLSLVVGAELNVQLSARRT